jgi:hypothetical protein
MHNIGSGHNKRGRDSMAFFSCILSNLLPPLQRNEFIIFMRKISFSTSIISPPNDDFAQKDWEGRQDTFSDKRYLIGPRMSEGKQ